MRFGLVFDNVLWSKPLLSLCWISAENSVLKGFTLLGHEDFTKCSNTCVLLFSKTKNSWNHSWPNELQSRVTDALFLQFLNYLYNSFYSYRLYHKMLCAKKRLFVCSYLHIKYQYQLTFNLLFSCSAQTTKAGEALD